MPQSRKRSVQQMTYRKKAMRSYSIVFHNSNDADIIDKLDSVGNKNDYIRQLIRRDIEKNQNE